MKTLSIKIQTDINANVKHQWSDYYTLIINGINQVRYCIENVHLLNVYFSINGLQNTLTTIYLPWYRNKNRK